MYAQPAVNGSLIKYARIDSIHTMDKNNVDSLFVDNSSGFAIGDTVLVYQTIGADPNKPFQGGPGQVGNLNNTGKYSIVKIKQIENRLIILNSHLPYFRNYEGGEFGQLVKVISYTSAKINSSFNFPPWDSAKKTGGIFAIIASGKLILDSNIRADEKGFQGAIPAGQYAGGCASETGSRFGKPFYIEGSADSSGLKGEGISRIDFPWKYGYGLLANGGGGGSGKFSGGGGGGNSGRGGKGGKESSSCSAAQDIGGEGGMLSGAFFTTVPGFASNRIFFGGGGGTSSQNLSSSRIPTAGGNGGGIVILITDTLVGNGFTISANGKAVGGTAKAGAGGGGAGGTIVLDVNTFEGPINLEVKGGKGGNASGAPDTTGAGGGGGGGVIWFNKASLPGGITTNVVPGDKGIVVNQIIPSAGPGSLGRTVNNLQVPINGFILNFMPGPQTICEGMIPAPIIASPAKGGSGTFTYKWLKSTSPFSVWVNANGTNTGVSYQPPALNELTRFRRVVNDGFISDSSFYMNINVHPKIQHNDFITSDTICQFDSPGILSSSGILSGGLGGPYNYRWIQSQDTQSWTNASGAFIHPSYNVPTLDDTIYYHRIVQSGACTDTSNLITIKVLGAINNNLISSSQEVCHNQLPNLLAGTNPSGGLPEKRYLWQTSDGSTWSNSVVTKNFNPPALASGIYEYRRIVYSGASNECIDTSNIVNIISWPSITNNELISKDSTICAGLPTVTLTGTIPENGSGSYKYVWQSGNSAGGPWIAAPSVNENTSFNPGTLNESKWFRRTIYSGAKDVCSSNSSAIKINVLPAIADNNISPNQLVCEGVIPQPIGGGAIVGGAGSGSYDYKWQSRIFGSAIFEDIVESGEDKSYTIPELTDSIEYRRIVSSGPQFTCRDTSDILLISFLPAITNNTIRGSSLREVCLEENIVLEADVIEGGNGTASYTWETSTNGTDWEIAAGNNASLNYTSGSLLSPKYFRRVARSLVCTDISEQVFADTLSLPLLTSLKLSADSVCHLEKNFYIKLNIRSGMQEYTISLNNGIDASDFIVSGIKQKDSVNIATFPAARLSYNYSLLSLADAKGCKAKSSNLGGFSSKLELFPDTEPEILIKDNTEICDNQLILKANKDIGEDFWWTMDNQEIQIDDPGRLNTRAYVSGNFDKQQGWLKFYSVSPGCKAISGYKPSADSVEITFYEQPEPLVIGKESDIIYLIDHYWVKHSSPTAGQLNWSTIEGGGENSRIASDSSLFISIPKDVKCVFLGTLSNGICNASTDEIILERKDVHVYEGISPANEDGINDFLIAEGLDNQDVKFEFQIFANNGLLVRTIKDNDIEKLGLKTGLEDNGLALWDGKAADEQTFVPPGIYYYVLLIDYKGKKFTKKGFVVVKE